MHQVVFCFDLGSTRVFHLSFFIFIHQGPVCPSSLFPPSPPPLSRSHGNQASSTCDAAHLLVLREGLPSTNHLPNSARRGWRKHLSRFAVDNREGHSLTESPARTAGSSVYSRRGLPQKRAISTCPVAGARPLACERRATKSLSSSEGVVDLLLLQPGTSSLTLTHLPKSLATRFPHPPLPP